MLQHLATDHEIVLPELRLIRLHEIESWSLVIERIQIAEAIFQAVAVHFGIADTHSADTLQPRKIAQA
jgi:hypothetical protein